MPSLLGLARTKDARQILTSLSASRGMAAGALMSGRQPTSRPSTLDTRVSMPHGRQARPMRVLQQAAA